MSFMKQYMLHKIKIENGWIYKKSYIPNKQTCYKACLLGNVILIYEMPYKTNIWKSGLFCTGHHFLFCLGRWKGTVKRILGQNLPTLVHY